jgi:uncharacterized protein (DUF885 family)
MRKMRHLMVAAAALAFYAPSVSAAEPAPHSATAASEDARLTAFLDAEFAKLLALMPETATYLGMKEGNDRFSDISDAGQLQLLEARRASVAAMKAAFDRNAHYPPGQTNNDILATELDRAETEYKFRRFAPPFYSYLYSAHAAYPDFLINAHRVGDAEDMRAYNARLRALPAALDQAIALSQASDAQGIHAPKFQIERVMDGSRAIITGAPFDDGADSPLWADAKAKVGKLASAGTVTSAEAGDLLAQSRSALLDLKPVYERVIAWAQADLPTAPSGRVGAISLPGGADWYAAALKLNTTLDLSADEIHQIGLREVTRIQGEQDRLARAAGFADRAAFYADRAKRFPPQPWTDALRADYLKRANDTLARNRALLPARFNNFPQYAMEVVREPSFSEVAGGAAHAAPPSPDGKRPGRVYVHMLGVTPDPALLTDLMCHEGVPGHVMAGDIQMRQTEVPKFRTAGGYTAFNEGWALYAEQLCKEIGAYPDIASDFMHLDQELWRAARLVVDTGIHAQGWTEQQAYEYLVGTAKLSENQARSEARRYITMPGQATGYKIGMLKIMDLRKRAETALGRKFDIKAFDDLIISEGSQPLAVLEKRVDAWIEANR